MSNAIPTVVIVGRPNVGKSTLFNRITGQRRAIVGDEPGITRDRIHGTAEHDGRPFEVIDTGGIVVQDQEYIPGQILHRAEYALKQGVKKEDVKQDPKGLNTLASVENAAKDHKALIIVTQNFHLPRAIFIARQLGIVATGLSADKHEYLKRFDFERRELLASTKAMIDLFWPLD